MKTHILWAVIGVLALGGILTIPVHQERYISAGTDSFASHYAIFSSRTVQHEFTTEEKTVGIGVIAVNMYRKQDLADVHVRIQEQETSTPLVNMVIPGNQVRDDAFIQVSLPTPPIPAGTHIRMEFSAPLATSQAPIGIRFDAVTKKIAFSVTERVPVWRAIATMVQNGTKNWKIATLPIIASLFLSIPGLLPKHVQRIGYFVLIAILLLVSLFMRVHVIPQFSGVSGGDAYNYLDITKVLIQGNNPFENTKRLPGFPALLIPMVASGLFDDHIVMRTVSTLGGIWSIGMIAIIARLLKFSWPITVMSMIILSFQKDFFWTSMRPEPYSVYTALLLTSIALFFKNYTQTSLWQRIAFGIVLGYAAMTRQEGFVLAAVLAVCSLLYELHIAYKTRTLNVGSRRFLLMYIPALLIVLPYFVHNTSSYGHPFYTPYLEGERLQIVDSFGAFTDAVGATWGIIGSMWKPQWDQLERISLSSPLFIVSCMFLVTWNILLRQNKNFAYKILTVVGTCVILSTIWLVIYEHTAFTTKIAVITAAWTLASIPLFIYQTRWKGIVILVVLVSQIGIATWFHPFAKHYQQSLPFLVLMIVSVLTVPLPKSLTTKTIIQVAILLPFLIVSSLLGHKITAAIDEQNEETALDSVAYRAARAARDLPGPIGFDQAYLPARLYFDPYAEYFPAEERPTAEIQSRWLAENPIHTLVVVNGNNVFETPHPSWGVLKTFKAAGKDDRIFVSTIYNIQ